MPSFVHTQYVGTWYSRYFRKIYYTVNLESRPRSLMIIFLGLIFFIVTVDRRQLFQAAFISCFLEKVASISVLCCTDVPSPSWFLVNGGYAGIRFDEMRKKGIDEISYSRSEFLLLADLSVQVSYYGASTLRQCSFLRLLKLHVSSMCLRSEYNQVPLQVAHHDDIFFQLT